MTQSRLQEAVDVCIGGLLSFHWLSDPKCMNLVSPWGWGCRWHKVSEIKCCKEIILKGEQNVLGCGRPNSCIGKSWSMVG